MDRLGQRNNANSSVTSTYIANKVHKAVICLLKGAHVKRRLKRFLKTIRVIAMSLNGDL